MGKLEYDQSIQHFSHEHPLELSKIQELPQNFPSTCSGCNLSSSDWIYTCKACKYVLHIPCTRYLKSFTTLQIPNMLASIVTYARGWGPNIGSTVQRLRLDVHLDCATSKPRISEIQHKVRVSQPQAPLQHHNLVPGSNQPQFNQPRNVSQQPNF
ncbi:hypothetical protein IFM89_028497, partial [Coptis chinensis]